MRIEIRVGNTIEFKAGPIIQKETIKDLLWIILCKLISNDGELELRGYCGLHEERSEVSLWMKE